MKKLLLLVLLLPLGSQAQAPNTLNNPNLPGYQNPSQQRLQTQMQAQQQQQQKTLNQQIQSQSLQQQQQLNNSLNTQRQRVLESQPGIRKAPPKNNEREKLGSQP
ncbi:DUF2756 domain-containing protein [Klebsiella sp. BIGb0407]|uniref:DUF2756 domain-containing protein n=1 Tax=Klebsiella sp. BIGb0407 TaxID=2940603 RepID=UPI0021675B01|nr:DUF2756 domain-containing protein [Klebsiella sp. BIGb0407]MCS3432810.1 small-conductance mechanosensitive channel [Klebsiella sp. BIGb0407]